MNEEEFLALTSEKWPSEDLEEVLKQGNLIWRDGETLIGIALEDCGHYSLGLLNQRTKSDTTTHIITIEELKSLPLDFNKFRFTSNRSIEIAQDKYLATIVQNSPRMDLQA